MLRSVAWGPAGGLPLVMWDVGARVLLDEAADAGGGMWLVHGDDLDRRHPVLDAAIMLRLCDTVRLPDVGVLQVCGVITAGRRTLQVDALDAVPAIVAVLLAIRARTGLIPHLSCAWHRRRPVFELADAVFGGRSATAHRIRSLIHRVEPVDGRRPSVHVW